MLQPLRSGTTAVVSLIRGKTLYAAWLGDSQAVLVRSGQAVDIVAPHKPNRVDEKKRIEALGGSVIYWGTWRVNGQLAVSRAIGKQIAHHTSFTYSTVCLYSGLRFGPANSGFIVSWEV